MSNRAPPQRELPPWEPKTRLGLQVAQGTITSLEEIFQNGWKLKEGEIVRALVPDIRDVVINVGIVQKQTDAGEMTRFAAIVAIGNDAGWFGLGRGKAHQMRLAIDKGINEALLHTIPIKLGCGSWECKCGKPHSIPVKAVGKAGSVRVEIYPGPRGLGLVAGEKVKRLLSLAGIKDAWTKTYGATSTASSIANAVYDAFKQTHRFTTTTG
ncbi:MAG: 30S ribosomal protein S5 [Nitrososphaerales archaeon]